jgi:regulator of sigma E protease
MAYVVIVLVVGLLIAIHECGHLLAAKLCGIPVKRFSVGFGPRVLEFKRGATSY